MPPFVEVGVEFDGDVGEVQRVAQVCEVDVVADGASGEGVAEAVEAGVGDGHGVLLVDHRAMVPMIATPARASLAVFTVSWLAWVRLSSARIPTVIAMPRKIPLS